MGEPLICPRCKKGTLFWINPDMETDDLFEIGIMECKNCKTQYKGFPEFNEALKKDGKQWR